MTECNGCGKPYAEFGCDLVLPDQQWAEIARPEEILCANCICQRLASAGATAVLAWANNDVVYGQSWLEDITTIEHDRLP